MMEENALLGKETRKKRGM